MAIKIAIYEDDINFRQPLRELIQMENDLELVGAFEDCLEIEKQVTELQPDVVLMDIELPHINGIAATKLLRAKNSKAEVLILTSFEDNQQVFAAILAGARGYIVKGEENTKIVDAIKQIIAGGAPMTPSIARKVLEFFASPTHKYEVDKLTPREFEILKLLKDGYSYKMIAANTFVELSTVQSHIKNIYKKLEVHSAPEAFKKIFKS
ncbi:response regulator [Adhaeribacter radiodurans]|uniref:Response regulator transcription factor n=1 Tax=Adhaeribacter radiodurans TaxID=2745197 RepID=A0A7L7L9A8_9BACT|nr:response regulator transcription factor [Adhaeribacter radiodurans]QMU29095.1 response regulator transcription factor [Adhaeribacter radiodurans]